MERGICPIAVLCFAIVLSSTLKTVGCQQAYKFYHNVILSLFRITWRHRSLDHKIRSGWFL